jgi:hypothetical protein
MQIRRPRVLAVVCVLTSSVCAGSAAAQSTPPADDVLSLSGPVTVTRGQRVGSITTLGGPTRLEGEVTGDVLAASGDVEVNGHVAGDVIALSGGVLLGPGARVGGDLVTPTEPMVLPGAQLHGTYRPIERGMSRTTQILGQLASWLAVTVSLFLLAMLLALVVPARSAENIYLAARDSPGRTLGVGLLTMFAVPLLAVLSMITLIGIPLGIAILAAFFFLSCIGYVTAGWLVGRRIAERRERTWPRVATVLIGLGILRLVALIPILSVLVWLLAASFGFGALVLAVVRLRAGTPIGPAAYPPGTPAEAM